MSDVGYIAAAYSLTAVALGAYVVRVVLRTRRAEGSLPHDDARR